MLLNKILLNSVLSGAVNGLVWTLIFIIFLWIISVARVRNPLNIPPNNLTSDPSN